MYLESPGVLLKRHHRSVDYNLLKYSKERKLVPQQEFCFCIVEMWGHVNNVPMEWHSLSFANNCRGQRVFMLQIITDFYFSCSPPSLSFNASIFIATKTRFFFSVYLVDLLIFTLQSFTKKKLLPRFSNAFTLEIPIFRFLARSLSFNEEASYLHVRFSTKHLMDSNSFSLNNIISR